MKPSSTLLGVGFFFTILLLATETRAQYERVLLSEVQALTLFKGRYTNARRTSPVPQLKCIGGYELCDEKYLPSAVQCYNMGTDGVDVQWRCDAELDKDVAFEAVHVSCEGYLDPDDPYVLDGSCGLEYKLKFTNAYHDRVKEARENLAARRRANSPYTTGTPDSDGGEGFKWFLLLAAVIMAVVWCSKKKPRAEPARFQVPPPSGAGVGFDPSGPPMYEHPKQAQYQSSTQPQGMDPVTAAGLGFVAGAATGAAASHVIHSHQVHSTEHHHTPSYATSRSSSHTGSSSPSRSPSSSGDTHTSKGFGTTSRR